MKKMIFLLFVIILFTNCYSNKKYYTKRTVTASIINQGEEKEVYKMTEIRDLETKKLVKRQEIIVENY